MAEPSYGHFGKASVYGAGLTILLLIVHLAIPYGFMQHGPPAGPEDRLVMRGEVLEMYDKYPDDSKFLGAASPNVALTGAIIALTGALLVAVMGFQPLSIQQARWIGVTGGSLAVFGCVLAFMQSMFAVGTGFASFWTNLFGGTFDLFWAISPFFVAGMCLVVIRFFFHVMAQVVMAADGVRGRVMQNLSTAWWAVIFMGTVLMMPWTVGQLDDDVSGRYSVELPGAKPASFFFSPEDVMSGTPVEADTENLRYAQSGDWGSMKASFNVQLTVTWFAVIAGIISSFMGVAVSLGSGRGLERIAPYIHIGTSLVLVAAAIMYVLAWVLVAPNSHTDAKFAPAFFPLLVLAPATILVIRLSGIMKENFQSPEATRAALA